MNSLTNEKQVYNDADMTTFLIYSFVPSNSYTQDAYICQQGQVSIKPKPERMGRDSESKHICCKEKIGHSLVP